VRPVDVHLQPDDLRVADLQEVLEPPDARRAGRPALIVQRALVEQEIVALVVVVRVELDALRLGDRAHRVPLVRGDVPVILVRAAGRVGAGAHVRQAEDVGHLQVPLELVAVLAGQRPRGRDEAMVALRHEAGVVEPAAQHAGALDGAEVRPAGRVGVLAVPGELHLPVAHVGEREEHVAEAGRQVGRERIPSDRVPDGVDDDAALGRWDEHAPRCGRGGRGGDRSRCRECRRGGDSRAGRAEEAAPAQTQSALEDFRGVDISVVVAHGRTVCRLLHESSKSLHTSEESSSWSARGRVVERMIGWTRRGS
jgi:hypothetical protein